MSSPSITAGTLPRPNWDMSLFWEYVKWFLSINQQWVMIGVAIVLAGFLIMMILSLFTKKEEDDEDYDIREI